MTAGQLVLLVLGAAVVVMVAFGLGVGVGSQGRPATAGSVASPSGGGGGVASEGGLPPRPEEPRLLMAEERATVPTPMPTAARTVVPTPVPTAAATPAPTAVPTLAPVTPVPTMGVPPTRKPSVVARKEAWVQAGAFSRVASADGVRQRVVALGFLPTQVRVVRGRDGKYRVWLGPFPDDESAGRVAARLRSQGFPGAFVVNE